MTDANTQPSPVGRLITAMVTPMTDDLRLDLDGAARVADQLVQDGCDGILVSGTTGEAPTTSDEEKVELIKAVLAAVGDRAKVIAGIGNNDTAHTIDQAKDAKGAGADGLLVVTPYYSKPTQEGVIAHFRAVADATDLPIVLYDIPGRTGIPIETDSLVRLAEHEHIIGVKDAKADLFAGSEVIASTGLRFFSGDDALNLPWLAVGAVGMISVVAHGFASDYRAMLDATDRGDFAEALAIHTRLIPAVSTIMAKSSQGAIRAKATVQLRGLIASRAMRLPLVPASDAEMAELRTLLQTAGKDVEAA